MGMGVGGLSALSIQDGARDPCVCVFCVYVCVCVCVCVSVCVRAGDSVSAKVLCFSATVCQFHFALYD